MLKGIQNFLNYINDNWTTILVIIGLCIGVYKKAESYLSKSTDEKIDIAKKQIQETMLNTIAKAEIEFSDWEQSGSVKRAKVIEDIFKKYPILSKALSKDDVIKFIDEEINKSLKTLRAVVKSNDDKGGV